MRYKLRNYDSKPREDAVLDAAVFANCVENLLLQQEEKGGQPIDSSIKPPYCKSLL